MTPRTLPATAATGIAEDVLLSVKEVSKRPPNPPPSPPRWLARFLPGAQWSAMGQRDDGMDDDPDEDAEDEMDDDPEVDARLSAIRDVSFELPSGSALGLVGPDPGARRALLWMIAGFVPPATGRILIRGHVAPLFNAAEINITRQTGKRAIKLAATFFHWPWKTIESRWDEITEFARIHEITQWPEDSMEFDAHRTKRLLLSTLLHMDASVYLVAGNFYAIEPEFVARCHALLEQRMQEGCAVVHSIGTPENLATFCTEAIYIDNGRPLFRGRLGAVAKFAHERPTVVEPGAAKLPIRATLVDDGPVSLGPDGGSLRIELDIFTKRLELTLGVLLVDEEGHRVRIEAPEHLNSHRAGMYTMTLQVPGGVLPRGTYRGTLLASLEDDPLDEESEAHALLDFDLEVTDGPSPSPDVVRITDEASWSVVDSRAGAGD